MQEVGYPLITGLANIDNQELVKSFEQFKKINSALEKVMNDCAQAKLECAKAQNSKKLEMARLNEQLEEVTRLFQILIQDGA